MVSALVKAGLWFLGAAGVAIGISFTASSIASSACDAAAPSQWCQRAEFFFMIAVVAAAVAALVLVLIVPGRLVWMWFTPLRFDMTRQWHLMYWPKDGRVAFSGVSTRARPEVQQSARSEAAIYVRGKRWAVLEGRKGAGVANFEQQFPALSGPRPDDGEQISVHVKVRPGWCGRTVSASGFPKVVYHD